MEQKWVVSTHQRSLVGIHNLLFVPVLAPASLPLKLQFHLHVFFIMVRYHSAHVPYGTMVVPEIIALSLVNSSVNLSKLFAEKQRF